MGRSDIFRTVAIVILITVFIATLWAINRQPVAPTVSDAPSASNPDDLSAELRRCSALGPQDAEDPHCRAVWEENRRRFFGRPAQPLPPPTAAQRAAPATPSSNSPASPTGPEGGAP